MKMVELNKMRYADKPEIKIQVLEAKLMKEYTNLSCVMKMRKKTYETDDVERKTRNPQWDHKPWLMKLAKDYELITFILKQDREEIAQIRVTYEVLISGLEAGRTWLNIRDKENNVNNDLKLLI